MDGFERLGSRWLRSGRKAASVRAGFTLVELLIVIAIIILLLSLLIVGLNAATRSAQRAKTTSLMQAIAQGLDRFKSEVGYLPPVLGPQRELLAPPASGGDLFEDTQNWYSTTSLAEYLVGYDTDRFDGYGNVGTGEVPLTGLRHPGSDGVWSAGTGALVDRDPATPQTGGPGKVYGPYIELDDERLLGSLDDDGETVRFPGEDGYGEPGEDGSNAKVICDYWGNPIQYFRRPYPPGALGQSYRAVAGADVPTLSWVVRLRPYRVAPGSEADVDPDFKDRWNDTTTSMRLQTGEFALFSPGPDRAFDAEYRADAGERNRDNLVEVGP